jgi:nucleotide-binding universal stress UspA family protein
MKRTIVWALDAFEPPGDLLQSAIRTLEVLASRLQANIQPVFILSPWQINLATEFGELAEGPGLDFYKQAAESAIEEVLKDVALPGLLSPNVIGVDSVSTGKAIEALSNYADLTDAEAILVSSHGRSGLGRLFLGSFAEKLILLSKRPVVVVHPGSQIKYDGSFKKILIPTDLTEVGFSYFERSLALAEKMQLEVVLFHTVPHPIEPVVQSGVFLLGGGWMPINEYVTGELERRQKKLNQWVEIGKGRGIPVRGLIHDEGGKSIGDLIVQIARKENTGLIVMNVQSGPITTAILGSVTREVVRAAECPVWVLRNAEREGRKNKDEAAA